MAFAVQTPSASTSEPYRYEEKADFTGGLNFRADQFNLLENESPDISSITKATTELEDSLQKLGPSQAPPSETEHGESSDDDTVEGEFKEV